MIDAPYKDKKRLFSNNVKAARKDDLTVYVYPI